jgi:hypothetical protein
MDSVMIDASEDSYFQLLRALNEHYSCFVTLIEPEKTGSGNERQPRLGMPRTRSELTVGIKDCIDIGGVRGTWAVGMHRAYAHFLRRRMERVTRNGTGSASIDGQSRAPPTFASRAPSSTCATTAS